MKKQLLIFSLLLILMSGMAKAQALQLWGMTRTGGANGSGTIYKMDSNGGSYAVVHSFSSANGSNPIGNLLKATNNKLYGVTSGGGAHGGGVLFSLNLSTFVFTKLVDFDLPTSATTTYGYSPTGTLIQDGNYLYGTNSSSGYGSDGTVFKFNIQTGACAKVFEFSGSSYGDTPVGHLLKASDGLIYGMTRFGGVNNYGILYRFDPSTALPTFSKWDLASAAGSACRDPRGSLIQGGNFLYGTTAQGGTCDKGAVFNFNLTTGVLQVVMNFCGHQADYGDAPLGSITANGMGTFYGMTSKGGSGTNDNGVIFKFTDYSTIHSTPYTFDNTTLKGTRPSGTLLKASNGKFYGVTSSGGVTPPSIGYGVAFCFDPANNSVTAIHNFTTGTNDGHSPTGDLVEFSCAVPSTPASITGTPVACFGINTTYSISAVSGATSYKWTAGGGNIQGSSTGTSIIVKFGNGGTNVTVKAVNGCGNSGTKTKTITVEHCLKGESEQITKEMNMEVFPNPTNGFATIKFSSNENQSCELIVADLTGRLIEHEQINSTAGMNELSLDLTNLVKGVYLVKVKTSEGETVKRIVRN